MHIHANHSLKENNTFGLDINARYFIEIFRQSDIPILRSDLQLSSIPWIIVGSGSNLLFASDLEKVVVKCSYDKIKIVKEDEDTVWLSVGAGMEWHDLVTYTVEKGWWGLENLALIPGTVGAAPVQNIGAYGSEARDTITRVQALNIYTGERIEFRNSECEFDYRSSVFKTKYVNQLLVHRVTFRLRKRHAGHPDLVHDPLIEAFKACPKQEIAPKDIFNEIIKIRQRKLPDPKIYGNAGSFFKNPIIDQTYFNELMEKLQVDEHHIPHHRTVDHDYKIPAAWLIEQAGWKGKQLNDAAVSDKHALVLINKGNAQGSDLIRLSKQIQQDVDHKFGIHLEREVIIIK